MWDACPDAPTSAEMTLPRGQASHKPRGRKPRHVPMPSGKATLLWGLDRAPGVRWRRAADLATGDGVPMVEANDVAPDAGLL